MTDDTTLHRLLDDTTLDATFDLARQLRRRENALNGRAGSNRFYFECPRWSTTTWLGLHPRTMRLRHEHVLEQSTHTPIGHVGDIWLDELERGDSKLTFERIEEFNDRIEEMRNSRDPEQRALVRYRRPVGIASMHRIMATARKALDDAVHIDGLIPRNPAVKVELPPEVRPKPLVWTEARVARWLERGETPAR